ncbi:MAG TPA: YfhO family protein [Myxococcus sp.]|nr:YfhO family protein [Myxococcus sp.]
MTGDTGREQEGAGPWRAWALPVLAVLLPGVFFHRAVFTSDVFMAGDTLRAFYPMRHYWAGRVASLELPEWYPYDGLGQSFPAIFISGVFHPTALLHLVLPLGAAVKATLLACFPAALLGTWALAREYGVPRAGALFCAVTFTFSGYLVCITNNPTYLLAASTVPAALWASVRFLRAPSPGRLALAGALLALVAFAGDAQAFAVTNALAVLVAGVDPEAGTWRQRVGACLLLVAAGGLLAAPQLLPAAHLALSGEPGARSAVEAQRFALHPLRLAELVAGPFLVDVEGGRGIPEVVVQHLVSTGYFTRAWVDSVHVGTPAAVLALAGLASAPRGSRTWALVGAWLLLLALCLGPALPFYGWVYELLPLWRPFRYPEKLVPLVLLGLAVAAGLGWKRCLAPGGRPRVVVGAALAVALPCAAVALGEALGGLWTRGWVLPRWPEVPPAVAEGLSGNVVRAGGTAAVLALACAAVVGLERLRALRGGLLVALQGAALFQAHEPLYHLSPAELLETPPSFVEPIREGVPPGEPVRIGSTVRAFTAPPLPGYGFRDRLALAQVAGMLPDTPALWGLESETGYLPGESVRVRRLKQDLAHWHARLAPRLATAFSVHRTEELARRGLPAPARVVARDPVFALSLVAHPEAVPRVHLARPVCVDGPEEAFRRLAAPGLPPSGTAIVECARPLPEAPEAPEGTVRVSRPAPERLSVDVESRAPAVLVVSDALQPGWTATLDGAGVPVLPANGAVMAVEVPAGRHEVRLRYRTPGLRAGLALGAAALLALGVAAAAGRRRRPTREAPGSGG